MSAAEKLPEMYTEDEAAAYFKKSVITLRRWRKAGLIGSKKIGRDVFFTAEHIRAYLESVECPASSTASPTSTPSLNERGPRTSTLSGGRKDRRSGALRAVAALTTPSDAHEN